LGIGSTPFAIMGKTKATNFLRLIAFGLVIMKLVYWLIVATIETHFIDFVIVVLIFIENPFANNV